MGLFKLSQTCSDVLVLSSHIEYFNFQPVASTINTLAGALYKVFSASPDQARNEMRRACFDYLSLGGVFSNGPISLLSGLNPRPLSLVCHFFAVAIFGVGRLLLPFPSPKRMWIGARLISVSTVSFPCYLFLLSASHYFDPWFDFTNAECIRNNLPNYQSWRCEADVLSSNCSCILQSSSCRVRILKAKVENTEAIFGSEVNWIALDLDNIMKEKQVKIMSFVLSNLVQSYVRVWNIKSMLKVLRIIVGIFKHRCQFRLIFVLRFLCFLCHCIDYLYWIRK